MLRTLANLDRRWIYVLVFASAIVPMILHVKLPSAAPSTNVIALYRQIQSLPDGSTVLASFDFEAGGETELGPLALVTLRQLFRKKCHVLALALWPIGSTEARKYLGLVASEFKKEGHPLTNGVDYVNLGYKPGGQIVIRQMESGFSTAFPTDVDGRPYDSIPMLAKVNSFRDVSFVLSYSVGTPGIKEWVNVLTTDYGLKVGGGVTAVSAPEMMPYLDSGQVTGLASGLRGAADYETLVGQPGPATLGMTVQNFVHLLILLLIFTSNVVYFLGRRRRRG